MCAYQWNSNKFVMAGYTLIANSQYYHQMPNYNFTRTRILKQFLGILSNQIEDYESIGCDHVKHAEILSLLRSPIFSQIFFFIILT